MSLKGLLYAYILGGFTFIPLVIAACIAFTVYTSVPVGEPDPKKGLRGQLEDESEEKRDQENEKDPAPSRGDLHDIPRTRKGWLTIRRTFEESSSDGGYVSLVRTFLDARSKDPRRSRPKDMWYVALKGKVLYLYEDESMADCEAAIELSGHDVVIYPEELPDAELFAKRNSICLKPKVPSSGLPSLTKEMKYDPPDPESELAQAGSKRTKGKDTLDQLKQLQESARDEALDPQTPWFIFVRSNVEMEDWYLALIHASDHPAQTPTLHPLLDVFRPQDMAHLVATLDEQPDVIPMRWFNGLIGRIFFSHYRTQSLESLIIGRLMKKLSKVKIPQFLTDVVVSEVSVGNTVPMFSKPMLKELTKEGDAAMEVHVSYKGEIRITVQATALIQLGSFKSYTVKLVLAAVVREVEGNLLIKVKRPPSNRLWYAFTQTPRMVMSVEPVVSDRQVTWNMILGTIESKLKEIIEESIVMPNMDDIAYFDSSSYSHRGGIWSDAARHAQKSSPPTGDGASVASEPAAVSPPVIDVSPDPSEEAPQPSSGGDDTPLSSPPEPSVLRSAATMPPTSSSGSAARRRTWFSGAENLSHSRQISEVLQDTSRGRSVVPEQAASVQRSRSTPEDPQTHSEAAGISNPIPERPHSPLPAESVDPNESSSLAGGEEPSESSASHTSRSLPESSGLSLARKSTESLRQQNPPASPTGFLSTLKARATDKQTLDTAKDTMRKWGVKWGGLKKELNNEEGVPDSAAYNERLRTQSAGPSHRPRASYADVRAAVTERRERNTGESREGSRSRTSSPVPIPESINAKARSVSYSGSPPDPEPAPQPGPSTSPATPLRNARSEEPSKGQESTSPNAAPIHIQPKGRTMTIPGIHAKHKGEVMSMGYVAPERPPSPPLETKLKNAPGIQWLWKTGSEPGAAPSSPPSTIPEDSSINNMATTTSPKRDRRSSDSSGLPSPQTSPRISSSLPARSTSASVSRPQLTPSKLSAESAQSSSDALKSIVTKDEEIRRASLELSRPSPTRSRKSSLGPSMFKASDDNEEEASRVDTSMNAIASAP